jgi:ABC-type uncharacterized transport system permease subunit
MPSAAPMTAVESSSGCRIERRASGRLRGPCWAAYASSAALWVGRIAGCIIGFAVAIIFAEVVFRSARDTAPLGITAILIVLGVFAGSRVALRFRKKPS